MSLMRNDSEMVMVKGRRVLYSGCDLCSDRAIVDRRTPSSRFMIRAVTALYDSCIQIGLRGRGPWAGPLQTYASPCLVVQIKRYTALSLQTDWRV